MCYIELKNDKYETSEDLKHLLQYILRLDKTAEVSQRANTITNTLAGCQPAMIPNEYLCDPSAVYHLMLFAVRRRQKGTTQFAKHRIVSFAVTDCILPQDVVSLAERIASIYAKNGFITAYGIHFWTSGTPNRTPPYPRISEPDRASATPGERWMCQYRLPARYGQLGIQP